MNERYLFRAKRVDNGKWIPGNLIHTKNGYCICKNPFECMTQYSSANGESFGFGGFVPVDPSTICQCTGLRDKNGNLIFEHGIVKECNSELIGEVKLGEHEKGYGWYIEWISERAKYYRTDFLYWHKELGLEAVGNIFDNPELLQEV